MFNKLCNIVFLCYLILLSPYVTGMNVLKKMSLKKKSQLESEAQANSQTLQFSPSETMKKCMGALMSSIPGDFCWKKGADVGIIPTGCPSGYFRFLALCYEYCGNGYTFVLGVCWAGCDSGYTDHGLSCFKNLFSWYFKHSYIPGSLTNFSSKIPCPSGMYRSGALCYRDCNNIGMENCGIGACAADGATCASKIGSMIQGVFEGIATAISTVVSFGGAAAAKTALKTGVKALAKSALNSVKNKLKKIFTSNIKNVVYNKAKELVKSKAKDFASEIANNIIPEVFCQQVWNASENNLNSQSSVEINEDSVLNAIDIFDIKGIVGGCSNTSDGGLGCATAVIGTLSNFDPTGLLTIASAFMQPVCDVTVKDYRITTEESTLITVIQEMPKVQDCREFDQKCLHLWSECNFKGNYFKYCNNSDFHEFNDKAKSLYVGNEIGITLFEHMSYAGSFLNFGPGSTISCLSEHKADVNLTAISSSALFDMGHCYFFNFQISQSTYREGNNHRFCDYMDPKYDLVIRADSKVSNKAFNMKTNIKGAQIQLWEGPDYTGKTVTIIGSKRFENKVEFGLDKIGSYKITVI